MADGVIPEALVPITLNALRDKHFESQQYVRSTTYEPCHPDCVHCRPRVEHFAELRANLEERAAQCKAAITALGGDVDGFGAPDG